MAAATVPALSGADLGVSSLPTFPSASGEVPLFPGGDRATRFRLTVDHVGTDVPVGVAVGLGVAGLATGFFVAFGVFGRPGGRRRTIS